MYVYPAIKTLYEYGLYGGVLPIPLLTRGKRRGNWVAAGQFGVSGSEAHETLHCLDGQTSQSSRGISGLSRRVFVPAPGVAAHIGTDFSNIQNENETRKRTATHGSTRNV